MIRSFGDDATEDIFHGANTKAARRIPKAVWSIVRRKLDVVNAAPGVNALRVPPLTFRFEGEDAHDVRCEDYH